ncbi:MAG TPA: ferritin family protein [Sedimentisphaerales bacterium]|nr:ferritin family protein [Sedimentisphaerales bacterium]
MKRFGSVDEILDFAIAREVEANKFYTELAQRMGSPAMREVFEEFAIEELGHKMKLEAVKGGQIKLKEEQVQSLEIADYVVEEEIRSDMSYADVLVVAMRKEKVSYRLYIDLAGAAEAEELTEMFLALAQEEAKHKLRFEIEYDDIILKED